MKRMLRRRASFVQPMNRSRQPRCRGAELHAPHRLQARGHRLGRERGRLGARPVEHEIDEQDDADHRHDEREQHHHDQLLGRLDEGGMRVVLGHGVG